MARRAESGRGVVVLARGRAQTTLAHEIGHFFGLCHTHQGNGRVDVERTIVDGATPETATIACPACSRTGDGVCDTPEDPGAEGGCVLDPAACTVECPGGARPDPTNLMSYYQPCRRKLTAEQGMYIRRFLARRLQWRACALAPAECSCSLDGPLPAEPTGCEGRHSQLRCDPAIPGASAGVCGLAGAGKRASPCRDDLDCEPGLVCVLGPEANAPLCRPRCRLDGAACTCLPWAPGAAVGVGGCVLDRER
jgi:hypothetical protein